MANEELKLEELTREQILDLADAQGRKLGFLLATSALDEDAKASIIGILEYAEPDQLNILIKMLEQGYLSAQNKEWEGWLKLELGKIKSEFDQKQAIFDQEAINKIEKLEIKLK